MESELIAWLRERMPSHPTLRMGIGDDAALLDPPREGQIVFTVDTVTDQVDFLLDEIDPRLAGRKALAVNLSDIAAMATEPWAAVISVVLPKRDGLELGKKIYEGMLPLAEKYHLALAGGDTNSWDGPLAITVALLGKTTPHGPLRRDGAKPGDSILVTGSFGGSILNKHCTFEPRIHEALLLNERYRLHAGMDVSDGLSLDLSRMMKESRCGAVLDLSAVPIAADAYSLAEKEKSGKTALEHALGDGEDFELLFTAPPEEAAKIIAEQPLEIPLTYIGRCVAESGLWRQNSSGDLSSLAPQGWEHF